MLVHNFNEFSFILSLKKELVGVIVLFRNELKFILEVVGFDKTFVLQI